MNRRFENILIHLLILLLKPYEVIYVFYMNLKGYTWNGLIWTKNTKTGWHKVDN